MAEPPSFPFTTESTPLSGSERLTEILVALRVQDDGFARPWETSRASDAFFESSIQAALSQCGSVQVANFGSSIKILESAKALIKHSRCVFRGFAISHDPINDAKTFLGDGVRKSLSEGARFRSLAAASTAPRSKKKKKKKKKQKIKKRKNSNIVNALRYPARKMCHPPQWTSSSNPNRCSATRPSLNLLPCPITLGLRRTGSQTSSRLPRHLLETLPH